ncbi:hypothetical protein PG989_001115 [Apiospora arundinis]
MASPPCPHGIEETETTPLLRTRSTASKPVSSWGREAKIMALWSAPLMLTQLLQRSITFASVFAVGRIGKVELGAVSVATLTTSMIGNTAIQGLANGLDTLTAQAYGSGQMHLVGLHTQRMVCFLLPCSIPLMVMWWNAEQALGYILPDHRTAELAGEYLRVMILRVPAFVLFECGKRFFQAQGIFYASTHVLVATAPLNALLMWLLVWHLGWGFIGAPVAIVITENLMALLLLLYAWLIDGSQCWGGFDRKALTNWGPMIRFAVPSMIMQCAEFAAEEAITIGTAQFGTSQLAAQSALVTIAQMIYIVPLGASTAASLRVANWIGAESVDGARIAARVAVQLGLALSLLIAVLLMSFRLYIPHLITEDAEVSDMLLQVMPIFVAFQLVDTMTSLSHGLLRGLGWQSVGGYMNLFGYYVVGLPISFAVAFGLGWQIYGMWVGLTIGLVTVCATEFWWIYRNDWTGAVSKAALRNKSS